ncbi:PAS domain-containing protein [Pseudomonas citronellolis]|uniref:PAS domain-containing protein n=1 Tax=Pseudomonas citronellolis TaxID=53408 RepID=UPI0023E39029|nr:PAS domain-containing protein [Pseudomonas citronellolis]MDF3933113.1 PAS domain-containing protein [Pseudomonas citronellolis]
MSAAAPEDDRYPVALLRLDAGGRIRRANRAWRGLMGEGSVGAELAAYLHREDLAHWTAALQLARAEPSGARQCLRFIDPGGRLRWFDLHLAGDAEGVYLSLSDATSRRQRDARLEASRRGAASLLDGLPGLIYRGRNNRQWTMEFVSAGCLQLTGYPADYLTDTYEHSYSTLILEEYAEYVWSEVQQALLRREPYELAYRIRCADGCIKDVWEKGVGIYSDTGEVLGIEGAIFEAVAAARE